MTRPLSTGRDSADKRRVRVSVAILAFGIAATVSAYTVGADTLFARLPFRSHQDLLWIGRSASSVSGSNGISWSAAETAKNRVRGLATSAAYISRSATVTVAGDLSETNRVAYVSGPFFAVLGVAPQMGRYLATEDDQTGAALSIVLSDSLWRAGFERRPDIVGSVVQVDGHDYAVAGVMPRQFQFPDPAVLAWMPLRPTLGPLLQSTDVPFLEVVSRLHHEADIERIREALSSVRFAVPEAGQRRYVGLRVEALGTRLTGNARPAVGLLFLIAALVQAVACVSAGAIQLGYVGRRRHVLAVKAALGATRARLVRELLTEAVVMSLASAGLAVVPTMALVAAARSQLALVLPSALGAHVSMDAFAFALLATLGTAVAVGLVMTLSVGSLDPGPTLKGGGENLATERQSTVLRNALLGTAFAVTFCLLTGAALLVQTLSRIWESDIGFTVDGVSVAEFRFPYAAVTPPEANRIRHFIDALQDQLGPATGVQSVAVSSDVPGVTHHVTFTVMAPGDVAGAQVGIGVITPDYFTTLGIPLLAGRPFRAFDDEQAELVAVLDEVAALTLFHGEPPVGRILRLTDIGQDARIVGVVARVRPAGASTALQPVVYIPFAQLPLSTFRVLTRSATGHDTALRLRNLASQADPSVSITRSQPLEALVYASTRNPRADAFLLGILGTISALMAAAGLYAVFSSLITERRREFAVRLAVGAPYHRLALWVLGRVAQVSIVGIGAGLILAAMLRRVAAAAIEGLVPLNWHGLVAAGVLLLMVALVAALPPVRRCYRVDGLTALRL